MIKNGLMRHKGLVALMTLLVVFVIVAIVANNYLDKNVIQRDYFSASRTEVLDQALQRVGPYDDQLREEILEHLSLMLKGGQLTSFYGPTWYKPAVNDDLIIASIVAVKLAAKDQDYEGFRVAYHNFNKLSTQTNFNALRRFENFRNLLACLFVIGFLVVLGLVLLRLIRSDEKAEQIKTENTQILSAVENGLFLIDRNYQIGQQKSDAVAAIFGKRDVMRGNFFDALNGKVSKDNLELSKDYIDLLFEGRVLQELIQDVNPLQEVEVKVVNRAGGQVRKFLNFSFSRNHTSERNETILASVRDVSNEVLLRRELEKTKEQQKERINLFVGLLHVPPEKLLGFCDDTIQEMREINKVLANEDLEDSRMRKKLNDIFRRAHRVKGDAATLGLSLFERSLHRFEDKIESLKKLKSIDGRSILELTVQLRDMVAEVEMVRNIAPQLEALIGDAAAEIPLQPKQAGRNDITTMDTVSTQLSEPSGEELEPVLEELQQVVKELKSEPQEPEFDVDGSEATRSDSLATDFENLVSTVSERQSKDVKLEVKGLVLLNSDSELSKSVASMCMQLVKNCVVHGLEPSAKRAATNKSGQGLVGINLRQTDDNMLEVIVRDDGQGLQYDAIRARAIKAKLLTAEQAESIKDTALLKYIFIPGFSSVEDIDLDAGRGVGLDFVRQEVNRLGGKLAVSSKAGAFTKFVLTLPLAS